MSISIGERTNLQDGTIVHVTGGMFDTVIGSDVLIGHRAIVHGATLETGVSLAWARPSWMARLLKLAQWWLLVQW